MYALHCIDEIFDSLNCIIFDQCHADIVDSHGLSVQLNDVTVNNYVLIPENFIIKIKNVI